jgi:hypothetical protein
VPFTSAWVKPPPQIGGLDHLAVQAPCINIYGRLLPGITNVTDRARYYSFYPWLIWAFDQAGIRDFNDEFIELFRRADCLFTLIAERHAVVQGDQYDRHAAAMVGSNTFAGVARSLEIPGQLALSDFAHRETATKRYFANKLGGLGQYYLGVLRELNILDGDSRNGIRYTRQIGQVIAERMDTGVNRDQFIDVVRSDVVTPAQLAALEAFCPCFLPTQPEEVSILEDLFFVRGLFRDVDALPRRRSLQSILFLARELAQNGQALSEANFRASTYTGHLPDGAPWVLPERLHGNRERWAIYSRNELLSVAVQGLFFALLDAYEQSGLRFQTVRQLVAWTMSTDEVRRSLDALEGEQPFGALVKRATAAMPDLADWQNELHEVSLAETVVGLGSIHGVSEQRAAIFLAGCRLLITLAARAPNSSNPYGSIEFESGYFRNYPINLRSFQHHCSTTWAGMSMREVLAWLLEHWGVELHLRVALRKLRGQSQSTFRIRPSDLGLEVIEPPAPAHTRPRFRQSLMILKDLGLLVDGDAGEQRPTDRSAALMELSDGS